MKPHHQLLLIIFSIITVIRADSCVAASKGKVFVLHSYHEEYSWVQGINSALTKRLEEVGLDYVFYYMDTKRRPTISWKEKAGELARKKIDAYKPDVVIAVDDNAKNYGISNYIGKEAPYLVFCGINDNADAHHYPPKNMTGIFERAYIHQTLDLLKSLYPQIEKVVFLSDNSVTAKPVLERAINYKSEGSLPVELIGFSTPTTFAEWQDIVKTFDESKDVDAFLIPLYHTVEQSESGAIMPSSEIMKWTKNNTLKPIVGLWPFSTRDGALAAVAVDPLEHGWTAADMAIKIINGTPISTLLPIINKSGSVHFNVSTAESLGLEISYDLLESFDVIIE